MEKEILQDLKRQLENELKNNILRFWIDKAQDRDKGGFYGFISNDLTVDGGHDRASVLTSRILWTFSAAYRLYREKKYLDAAIRAFDYLTKYFIDPEFSGVFWLVNHNGQPVDAKKQIYAIAFAIYGLSEYHRATGDKRALSHAIELFAGLEKYARDPVRKGYLEALSRDWSPLADMSLSPKDLNVAKSMNTHLHLLEAYTNLLRIWDSVLLRNTLKELLEVMLEHIVDRKTWSFRLFFDPDWTSRADITSYGHDIEGSWLIYEAAEAHGNAAILQKAGDVSLHMAESVLRNGIDAVYGGIYNDRQGSRIDRSKDWWPQAEAVVGFFNAYELSSDPRYLDASLGAWNFINRHLVDRINGEWFRGVTRDGGSVTGNEKAGPWKCPYHNSRMCFEMIARIDKLANRREGFQAAIKEARG